MLHCANLCWRCGPSKAAPGDKRTGFHWRHNWNYNSRLLLFIGMLVLNGFRVASVQFWTDFFTNQWRWLIGTVYFVNMDVLRHLAQTVAFPVCCAENGAWIHRQSSLQLHFLLLLRSDRGPSSFASLSNPGLQSWTAVMRESDIAQISEAPGLRSCLLGVPSASDKEKWLAGTASDSKRLSNVAVLLGNPMSSSNDK